MKKFTKNDIFYNQILTNPKYVIKMYSGSMTVNNQLEQNYEYSSSLSLVEYPTEVKFENTQGLMYTGSYVYTSSVSREFIRRYPSNADSPIEAFDPSYTSYVSIKKILALRNVFKDYIFENKYANLKYYLKYNEKPLKPIPENEKGKLSDLDALFYLEITPSTQFTHAYCIIPSCSINIIEIPKDYYGEYINPGSLTLNMYISGTLICTAKDYNKNGQIIQTYGLNGTRTTVGSIFYDEGIILLTGSHNLSTRDQPYIKPLPKFASSSVVTVDGINYNTTVAPEINDYARWIYFGSYINTSGSAIETEYELIFEGTKYVPTLTMMCHVEKNELFWSNNRTFLEAGQIYDLYTGQLTSSLDKTGSLYFAASGSFLLPSDGKFKEDPMVFIKNTISSSFEHYSASYQPQVFISQIGIYDEQKNLIAIAKLANPVRKTKDLDYTFKLKLDM